MPAWSEAVALRHRGGPAAPRRPAPRARLREPTGADELALAGVDTAAGLAWLDALLDGASAPALSASERDALFAAQHRALWGDRILSTLECASCQAQFDLSFQLSALQQQLAAQEPSAQGDANAQPCSVRDAPRGRDWRLSRAADELAALQWGWQDGRSLLARLARGELQCLDDGDADGATALTEAEIADAAARLELLAPLIDVDLDADCPECACAHRVRFDIQSWVLQRLLDERPQLLAEVHTLAAGYGWTFAEITALPRGLRRELAERLQGASAWPRSAP